jgi:Ca2+-binding EF-hand superfamily protein
MSGIGSIGSSYNPYASQIQQFQKNLFAKIDSNGDGSISKTELEQAVTGDGGTAQSADALFSTLDPNNTGSVTPQQFSQNLPVPPFSPEMGAQLIAAQSQQTSGALGGSSTGSLAQTLFSQIDTNGDGSISKSELEKAVTSAGGSTQAADALFSKLDPNNTGSVSEQQFSAALSQASASHGGHHHHRAEGANDGSSAQDALASLLKGTGGSGSPAQIAQNLFSQIDTNGDGSISKTELEAAVTSAGGTTQGADSLYAQLDPNNTGSVTAQSFAQYLQPPSPTGNTAQDAVLALLDPTTPGTPAAGTASFTMPSVGASASNNSASDALWALVNGNSSGATSAAHQHSASDALWSMINGGSAQSAVAGSNSAQDALMALINGSASESGSNAGASNLAATLPFTQAMDASAQTNQQIFASLFGSGGMLV